MDSSIILFAIPYIIFITPITNKYTYYLESFSTDLHLWYNCFDYSV